MIEMVAPACNSNNNSNRFISLGFIRGLGSIRWCMGVVADEERREEEEHMHGGDLDQPEAGRSIGSGTGRVCR